MASNTKNPAQRLKPNLTGAQETLLAILFSRALDAKTSTPILGDQSAVRLVDQLDYDFSKLRVFWLKAAAIALRARLLDQWTAEFLQESQHDSEPITVLHLAAGLDTRALRLQEHCNKDGANVRWIDADLPDVIDVRRRLHLPEPNSDRMQYEMVAADVTDELWLAKLRLPRDRKTLVVFEGLTMYLQPAEGRALIEQLTDYFFRAGNQLVFDCFNWFPLLVQRLEPIVASTGSRMSWAINDPRELEGWHSGLHLTGEILPSDNPENVRLPIIMRLFCWIVSFIPGLRNSARYLRYEW
ncbi:tetracenomycin polyketide synthesis O-methyltransferase TcmP [Diaporthe sp. PMI_573]|nr:tetracenomycin polyketide synthesis O-methyltransferase TcmP [Diaporthaceae sp. PMI_573]